MKNFLKRKRKQHSGEEESPSRITNETVAEHRELVLAGGRKFKYPVQYQKHKLVINSVIIGLAAVTILIVLGWQWLYVYQDSSKLIYRITQIIPVNVAEVDGEPVRYSDYLMRYRSSIFYLQKQESINLATADGKRQSEFYKRKELTSAEMNALVVKLARERRITVKAEEVTSFIKKDVDASLVSLNAYEKSVLNSYYDWSMDEYRSIVESRLLKRKVAFAVDSAAKKKAEELLRSVQTGADIAAVAGASSDDLVTKTSGGDSGLLPVGNLDPDGLIAVAQKLEANQLSGLIEGVDGYYFIKLLQKTKDNVQYRVVKVSLTEFDKQFASLQKSGKIKEYISVQNASTQ